MATIEYTHETGEHKYGADCHLVQWPAMGDADTGAAFEMPGAVERSVQVAGSFGSAAVVIQGSNDGANWATLSDPSGEPLSFTDAAVAAVLEMTRYVRPKTSGGTATDVDVTMMFRRA